MKSGRELRQHLRVCILAVCTMLPLSRVAQIVHVDRRVVSELMAITSRGVRVAVEVRAGRHYSVGCNNGHNAHQQD